MSGERSNRAHQEQHTHPHPRVTRRAALKLLGAAGLSVLISRAPANTAGSGERGWQPSVEFGRWPALGLRIATPGSGAVPELDLRSDFGAAGDGVQDDEPAFLTLAAAVNAGRVAPGSVVLVPPGRYRVVGNQTITFRRPIVLRGAGVGETTIQRHDFAGAAPRLYRWRPMSGFGIEHLTIEDRSDIADTEEANTFKAVQLDGVVDGWVWDVHFRNNTSIPLSVGRSGRVAVCECVFDGARHVGGGGNGYLPEISFSDDCLVEYCSSLAGRHALICNWSCWGNVFRYNRLIGTPNTETHGEYSVENLYLRNDCRGSRMEIGGGGNDVHAHDGPHNELVENYARVLRALKRSDRENRLIGNWHVEPTMDIGTGTVQESNQRVAAGWDEYPFAAFCGHDHQLTAETARPG